MRLPNNKETWEQDLIAAMTAKSIPTNLVINGERGNIVAYDDLEGKTVYRSLDRILYHIQTEGYRKEQGRG